MPEEQGNSLFSSLKKFLTDLSIEGGIKNVLSNADILANLPLPDLLDVILAAIVVVCYSAALPLLAYRPPWSSFVALAVAGAIMLLLVWRKRRRRIVTPKEGQKHLSRRQKLVIKAVLSGGIFLGIGYFGLHLYRTFQFRNELKDSGLPSDLYDRQDHLEALAINQGSPVKPPYLKDLDWLNTSSIQKLTLATPNLTSLNGLTRMKQLESLDVDLKSVPAESVSAVSSLNHLGRLVLRNMGRKAKQPALDLSAFPELRTLEFDFERSSTSGLPSLNGCPELQDLTLNLRSTAAISEPPDLSDLKQLHFLKLFLDNSQVRSLRPLTTTDSLQTVTLSLDGTQLELLKDLDSSPGIPSLTLLLTSPPNDPLPDLSGIRELISLTLQMPGPRGSDLPDKTPIPDITYLGNLQALSLSLKGSEVRSLPDITRLNRLRIVDLDLEGSSVENLPEISKLQDLEELALNLNSTKIRELPNFAQSPTLFPKLTKLHLKLAHSKIKVLHDIEHLSDLNTLELDIRGTTVDDISSIAKFTKLENLTLYLDWSQVHDLPDLSPLKSLKVMELHISGWWATEQLPNLSNLPNLGKVKLVVEGSQIKDWSPVEHITNLQELELDLKGASTETLPDLNSLQKLSRVAVDLRHSGIKLSATRNLRALQELTIDKSFGSLEGLPKSLKKLALEP